MVVASCLAYFGLLLLSLNAASFSNAACILPQVGNTVFTFGSSQQNSTHEFVPGTILRVYCREGFASTGTFIQCRPNGNWEGLESSQCHLLGNQYCGPASLVIPNGCYTRREIVEGCDEPLGRFKVGTLLFAKCQKNYSLINESAIECQPGGLWEMLSEEFPECIKDPQYCHPPEPVEHGFYTFRGLQIREFELGQLTHNTELAINCDRDFSLHGYGMVKCRNGTFDQPRGQCVAMRDCCKNPETVEDGHYLVGSERIHESNVDCYSLGTTLTVECNLGYVLNGNSTVDCVKESKEFSKPGSCKRTTTCCKPPRAVANAYYVSQGQWLSERDIQCLAPGQTLAIECYWGYELAGRNNITCSEVTETFNNPGWCVSMTTTTLGCCQRPNKVTNGFYTAAGWPLFEEDMRCLAVGSVLSLECLWGYKVFGRSSVRCSESTNTFEDPGRCMPAPTRKVSIMARSRRCCNRPPLVLNGQLLSGGFPVSPTASSCRIPGSTLDIICLEGYRLEGRSKIRCSRASKKFQTPGVCRQVRTGNQTLEPVFPANGLSNLASRDTEIIVLDSLAIGGIILSLVLLIAIVTITLILFKYGVLC